MIRVLIPSDIGFNYRQCKKLYKKYQKQIADNQEFRDVVKNTFFYSFFDDDRHIGCIYYYKRNDGRLYVNAFANRHNHEINIKCLKMSLEWFNCDIWAESQLKTAVYCLYKCGFEKENENLYKYERSKYGRRVKF